MSSSRKRGSDSRFRGNDKWIARRARRIRLLIVDVDGVLTDGRMIVDSNGTETKSFDVKDGLGLVLAGKAGLKTAIITAERSPVVSSRARRLKIGWVAQGAKDKSEALDRCLKFFGVTEVEAAYIGDDLLDGPVLARVGLSAAVADARPEIKAVVHYVTRACGGHGAVREFTELILRAQGKWAPIVKRYLKRA
jgi:3-deoxy-D-manno-octulosonate 8-phosphate phosphatase (KDO 8-P phosphatase)